MQRLDEAEKVLFTYSDGVDLTVLLKADFTSPAWTHGGFTAAT